MWPVDFNSFYLHSKHESAVVGIDLTADGQKARHVGQCLEMVPVEPPGFIASPELSRKMLTPKLAQPGGV